MFKEEFRPQLDEEAHKMYKELAKLFIGGQHGFKEKMTKLNKLKEEGYGDGVKAMYEVEFGKSSPDEYVEIGSNMDTYG
ncbi:MAG: hypothetical protein ABIG60_03215 [Patescibacteria group bacterium]